MTVRAVSNNPSSPFYNSSAPNLTGSAGALTTVLDAVLVNGFSGFTALGWSIAETTTSKRGYQQASGGNSGATGLCLWIDDTGPGAGGAREARATGFETMTGLGTGTGQFPTGAQLNIGTTPNGAVVIRKSATADSTTRFYTIVGNGHSFYLFAESGDYTNPTVPFGFFFGDFFSFHASDAYAIAIIGRTAENTNAGANEGIAQCQGIGLNTGDLGQFVDRAWTGVGGSQQSGLNYDCGHMGNVGSYGYNASAAPGYNSTTTFFAYPNSADGALYVSPMRIHQNNVMRGYLPGYWSCLQPKPLNHGDTFTVSGGNLNGKSMIAINVVLGVFNGPVTASGQIMIETSDTWA